MTIADHTDPHGPPGDPTDPADPARQTHDSGQAAAGPANPANPAELADVQARVDAAHVLLARLLQEVVVAESRLKHQQTAQLLEANEQLVVAALRHQSEAEVATEALARLAHSAELDELTQLPNRGLLQDRLSQALALAHRRGGQLAVLFLDLNNFKQVNDTLGHAAGDAVLQMVARRLLATVRSADTVSRHGGDEFVILLTDITRADDARRIATGLISALGEPARFGDAVLRITASVGISLFPQDGDNVAILLAHADAAMYAAKRQGRGSVGFHADAGAPSPAAPVPALQALLDPVARHASAVAARRHHHDELREANEQLVLAALGAQELQAAAELAHRRQAEFMAVVARELANPLAPIRLAAAMLGREQATSPLLPQTRAIIERQVADMDQLVGALQAMTQAGAAAFRLQRERVDLVGVIDAAIAACRPALDTRLQTLTLHLPTQAVIVAGEPRRLGQVVRNLLDNASKYTPDHGCIELALQVQAGSAQLAITDNGIGITALTLPTLFDPFVQDLHALNYNGTGLGIGLTVVRALVEAHGGSVSAASAGRGSGSCFTVNLPLLDDADADAAASPAQPAAASPPDPAAAAPPR